MAYFKGLGAEISAERSDKGIEDDLHKIIGVCDACFKDASNPNQIEEVLNGIVSMFALVSCLELFFTGCGTRIVPPLLQ